MNKFKTDNNGGLPFVLDDLRWMQDNFIDAFNNILKEFAIDTNSNFIISGCIASMNNGLSITAGYIYLNGEVVKVDAQLNVSSFNPVDYWALSKITTYDPAGLKEFNNGNSYDTYQKNRGVIAGYTGTCPANLLQIYPVISNRLSDKVLLALMMKADTEWITVGGEISGYHDSWSAMQGMEVKFRKDMNGRITIYGRCSSDDPAQHPNIFLLPAGYRPAQELMFYTMTLKTPLVDSLVKIDTDGYVSFVDGELLNTTANVNLDGISFMI